MGKSKSTNESSAQGEKAPRKKRTIKAKIEVTYAGGFKPGNIVIVTSKTTFVGSAIGAVVEPQKWCDGGIPVATTHDIYKNVCIRTQYGDTIIKVSKK